MTGAHVTRTFDGSIGNPSGRVIAVSNRTAGGAVNFTETVGGSISSTGSGTGILIDGSSSATMPIAAQARTGATGHFDVCGDMVAFPNGIGAGVHGVRVREDSSATASGAEPARGASAANDPVTMLAANDSGAGTEVLGGVTVTETSAFVLPAAPSVPSRAAGAERRDAPPAWAEQRRGSRSSGLRRRPP